MIMKRTMKRALAATAIAAIGAVAAVAVTAAPAQAICRGNGSSAETMSFRIHNGQTIAVEKAKEGTCDSDGLYLGYLKDPLTDGYAARIRYRDSSFNQVVAYAPGGYWSDYHFYDRNGNHSADYQLYAGPGTRPTHWGSTWGY